MIYAFLIFPPTCNQYRPMGLHNARNTPKLLCDRMAAKRKALPKQRVATTGGFVAYSAHDYNSYAGRMKSRLNKESGPLGRARGRCSVNSVILGTGCVPSQIVTELAELPPKLTRTGNHHHRWDTKLEEGSAQSIPMSKRKVNYRITSLGTGTLFR